MSQKTITVSGKTFSANQVANMMDGAPTTDGGTTKFVNLNGIEYWAEFREASDGYFAPATSKRENAAYVALGRIDMQQYSLPTWLEL